MRENQCRECGHYHNDHAEGCVATRVSYKAYKNNEDLKKIDITRRSSRQKIVSQWAVNCFGAFEALDVSQRSGRLLEESIEVAQAAGIDKEVCLDLVTYIYSRPKGDITQELGGVSLCALALAEALKVDADSVELKEIKRVLNKAADHFTERNQAKNTAGFNFTKKEKI